MDFAESIFSSDSSTQSSGSGGQSSSHLESSLPPSFSLENDQIFLDLDTADFLSSDFEFLDLSEIEDQNQNISYFSDQFQRIQYSYESQGQPPESTMISSTMQQNNQYINSLLKNPKMTPARLSLIMNYKDNPTKSTYIPYQRKRRHRLPPSEESRLKKNFKRRSRAYPMIIKTDIRKDYMKMLFNVINSGDFPFIRSFLDRYFVPDCKLAKAMLHSYGSPLKDKFKTQGIDNLMEFIKLLIDNSPDFIMKLNDVHIRVNPKNLQSILVAKFNFSGTRYKFRQSGFSMFLSQLKSFPQHFLSSLFSRKSSQTEIKSEVSIDDLSSIDGYIDIEDGDNKVNIKELNRENFFISYLQNVSPVNLQLSQQIANILFNINIFQLLKASLQEADPFLLLPSSLPGIKFDSECMFYLYLDYHNRVTKLELLIGQIKLEISTSDFLKNTSK